MFTSILSAGLISLSAAAAPAPTAAPATATGERATELSAEIDVGVGQSSIVTAPRAIARVLVSDRDVASVQLLEEGQIQVLGEALGTTDLWVWYRGEPGQPHRTLLTVRRDLSDLDRRIGELFPDASPVKTLTLNNRVVLQGAVPDVEMLEAVSALARTYDADFVNLMTVSGDHSVQLRVVFAEVNRTRLRELGLDALWDSGTLLPRGALSLSATAPTSSSAAFSLGGTFSGDWGLSSTLEVLESHQLSRVLARPTLVALSGQQAEFLAGGEVPIPVSQYGDRVSIEFREYGVKVVFVPTVLADEVIDLQVYVEVSDVDPNNAVTLSDIAIPALSSRKSSSHVRLQSGMTFALAGLLDETVRASSSGVPGLSRIPVLGALFRQVKHEREERELMITVTPELVRPLAPGEVPAPPGTEQMDDPNNPEFYLLGRLTHGAPPEPITEVGLED